MRYAPATSIRNATRATFGCATKRAPSGLRFVRSKRRARDAVRLDLDLAAHLAAVGKLEVERHAPERRVDGLHGRAAEQVARHVDVRGRCGFDLHAAERAGLRTALLAEKRAVTPAVSPCADLDLVDHDAKAGSSRRARGTRPASIRSARRASCPAPCRRGTPSPGRRGRDQDARTVLSKKRVVIDGDLGRALVLEHAFDVPDCILDHIGLLVGDCRAAEQEHEEQRYQAASIENPTRCPSPWRTRLWCRTLRDASRLFRRALAERRARPLATARQLAHRAGVRGRGLPATHRPRSREWPLGPATRRTSRPKETRTSRSRDACRG